MKVLHAAVSFLLFSSSASGARMRRELEGESKKSYESSKSMSKSTKTKGTKDSVMKSTKGDDDEKPPHTEMPPSDLVAHSFGDHIVIANRGAGTISIVNPSTLETVVEYPLPDGGEPMYFACSKTKSELWVGDRANNRLVILKMDGDELVPDGYLSTPEGLFHSMITQEGEEAYPIAVTSCDIANVTVVHDLTTRRLLATLERPSAAIEAGAKPHDVTTNGDYIIVTFLGTADGAGYVASYDAYTFKLIAVLETVSDPHVAVRDSTSLFIAAQGGEVIKASIPDLEVLKTTPRPTPHGMFISFDSKYLYTTNIGQEGQEAVDVWNVDTGKRMDCPTVTTTFPVPHNPTVSMDGKMIVITHSGATSKMNSAFMIGSDGCVDPESEMTFETNLNPFGLFIIPPAEPVCLN